MRNERGEIKTDAKEIQKIVRKYCEQLCADKLDNLDEMEFQSSRTKSGRIREYENLNRQITPSEIEAILKKLPTNKSP